MNVDHPLVSARSSLVWIMAIVCAFGAVAWIEKESGKPLIAQDREAAREAWSSFDSHKAACSEGSALMALVSARKLALLTAQEFDARMSAELAALAKSPADVTMDALERSRVAAALQVIASTYPLHADAARAAAPKPERADSKAVSARTSACDTSALMLESLAYTGGSR